MVGLRKYKVITYILIIFVAESEIYIFTYYALSSNTLRTKGYYSIK